MRVYRNMYLLVYWMYSRSFQRPIRLRRLLGCRRPPAQPLQSLALVAAAAPRFRFRSRPAGSLQRLAPMPAAAAAAAPRLRFRSRLRQCSVQSLALLAAAPPSRQGWAKSSSYASISKSLQQLLTIGSRRPSRIWIFSKCCRHQGVTTSFLAGQ
jgi:hypothetical protein